MAGVPNLLPFSPITARFSLTGLVSSLPIAAIENHDAPVRSRFFLLDLHYVLFICIAYTTDSWPKVIKVGRKLGVHFIIGRFQGWTLELAV